MNLLAGATGTFTVGETITNSSGPMVTAIVLGYTITNGEPVLAYELTSVANFVNGDVVVGSTSGATGTVTGSPEPSGFLVALDGDGIPNPAGAGYLFPDQSPTLPDVLGIQYGCSLSREVDYPDKDTFQVIEDIYVQGDVRGSIRR